MQDPQEYMLAEFKGTYRAPHPDGIRDQNILREFHVKVKMKKEFLKAPGLNGLFITHYLNFLKSKYPSMLETYQFEMLEATELNGKAINDPKALSYNGLLKYIKDRRYPINASLYSRAELRNQVVLYEQDSTGQQFLQGRLEEQKGGQIAIANELMQIDDIIEIIPVQPELKETPQIKSKFSEKRLQELMR